MTVITVEQARAQGITPKQLRACAAANDNKNARRTQQANELRRVAEQLAAANKRAA